MVESRFLTEKRLPLPARFRYFTAGTRVAYGASTSFAYAAAMDTVVWDGAMNARWVTPTLVRMGRREWITEAGWKQAADQGLRTVVDLRYHTECGARPGQPVVSPTLLSDLDITVVELSTEDPTDPAYASTLQPGSPYMDHPASYGAYLDAFSSRISDALCALAHGDGNPEHVVAVHCAAGRDRTGLLVALGQLFTHWPHAEIVDGYLRAAEGVNQWWNRGRTHPHERRLVGEEWERYLNPRVEALRVFLASFDVTAFLAQHAWTPDDLEALQRRFTPVAAG